MGAAKRQQKYKAAEKASVSATSDMLQSRLSRQRNVDSDAASGLKAKASKAVAVSKKADSIKASLKAPSTKMKKAK